MWILVIFVFAALLVINFVGYLEGKSGKTTGRHVVFMLASGFVIVLVLWANYTGGNESKISGGGNYYEVVTTTSIPKEGTLVYAVDLDGDKGKADILAEYPMKGYKVQKIGGRTFLLPEDTRVAYEEDEVIVFVSGEGEAVTAPIASNSLEVKRMMIRPPFSQTEIQLTQFWVGVEPPVSFPEDEIPGEGEEKALLVATYGQERTLTVLVPFNSKK